MRTLLRPGTRRLLGPERTEEILQLPRLSGGRLPAELPHDRLQSALGGSWCMYRDTSLEGSNAPPHAVVLDEPASCARVGVDCLQYRAHSPTPRTREAGPRAPQAQREAIASNLGVAVQGSGFRVYALEIRG